MFIERSMLRLLGLAQVPYGRHGVFLEDILIRLDRHCFKSKAHGEISDMKVNESYKYRKIAGKDYLIPVREAARKWDAPLQLTETAAWIWTALEAGKPCEDIVEGMTEVFEVEQDVAERAVAGFCLSLLQQGLLTDSE